MSYLYLSFLRFLTGTTPYEDWDAPITAEEPTKAESDQGPSVQPHKQADQTRRGKNVLQQKTGLVD